MTRRKQSFPARAKCSNISSVNAELESVGIEHNHVAIDSQNNENVIRLRNKEDILISFPILDGECGIDVAEVSLENVTYHLHAPFLECRCTCTRDSLKARIRLLNTGKNFFSAVHALTTDNVIVEIFGQEAAKEGSTSFDAGERSPSVVILSGQLDGPITFISGLVYLFKQGFINLKPSYQSTVSSDLCVLGSCRLCVTITKKAILNSNGLFDNARPYWRRSMQDVLLWLRPEVQTDEAIYGVLLNQQTLEDSLDLGDNSDRQLDEQAENSYNQQSVFDPALLYEAIKPSRDEPRLDVDLPDLLPNLRPYQSRAACWMVKREKGFYADFPDNLYGLKRNQTGKVLKCPLSVRVESTSGVSSFYYNPFSGCVSEHPIDTLPAVRGGILADEMGLGKTVEVLACILANRFDATEVGLSKRVAAAKLASKKLDETLKKRKRVRIDCPCGAKDEHHSYAGLWVQCDCCDCWQHASCVGFGLESKLEEPHRQQARYVLCERQKKRKHSDIERVYASEAYAEIGDEGFLCGACAEAIGSVEVDGISGATLIVCPTPILGQWEEEITRHTKQGCLKVIIYEGVRKGCSVLTYGLEYTSNVDKHIKVVGAHVLAMADIVLTTYDTLRADLLHDSEGTENSQRTMRFQKRYPVVPTPLTRLHWWRVCLDEAQMVESNTARAADMALRLTAEHRWCISGTPIQRSLDDLYGLLKFLVAEPFDDYCWWSKALKKPYEQGNARATYFMHAYLRQLLWRSSKVQVSDELGLPPQEEKITWLKFSPVEAHFYREQHDRCAIKAHELISDYKKLSERMQFQIKNQSALIHLGTNSKPDGVSLLGQQSHSGHKVEVGRLSFDRPLTDVEVAKLMKPLLMLRQACCHPQIGSAGLRSLQRSPMTMDEILMVLVEKAKIECEDAQRDLLGALNGLAALQIIERNFSLAVSTYREALQLIQENADEFRVDPLQRLHILHNLAELLRQCRKTDAAKHEADHESASNAANEIMASDDVPRTLRDEFLLEQCKEIKSKYMSTYYSKLFTASQDFRNAQQQVIINFEELKNLQGTSWWLHALSLTNHSGAKLVEKIRNSLLEGDAYGLSRVGCQNASSFAHSFRDVHGLTFILKRELDAIGTHRKDLIGRITEIDSMMHNPNDDIIERAVHCSNCNDKKTGPPCVHCELDKVFDLYESRLFLLKSSATNVGGIVSVEDASLARQRKRMLYHEAKGAKSKDSIEINDELGRHQRNRQANETARAEVTWAPSETEMILRIIMASSKHAKERNIVLAAKKHLLAFEAMRKEFSQARILAVAQRSTLFAHDELNMAVTRLCLRHPEEDADSRDETFKLHPEEVPQRNVQLTADKFKAAEELLRAKGKLRYLKGLAFSRKKLLESKTAEVGVASCDLGNDSEGGRFPYAKSECLTSDKDTCPVCQEPLGDQFMVLPCGHLLCCKCLMTMVERISKSAAAVERKKIFCPSCRHCTHVEDIAFVDNGEGKNNFSDTFSKLQDGEQAKEFPVKGSYGTKMEAVIQRILWIRSKDPNAKFLIFSTWNDVLDVVEHALAANDIRSVRAKGRRDMETAICQFKGRTECSIKRPLKKNSQSQEEPVHVLLLLIKQGANGLNLVEARHVILIEPLLNPGAEAQAINRVHRIGQLHVTFVHRFLISETVEESIYRLGRHKALSHNSTILSRRNKQDHFTLTINDVSMLFAPKTQHGTISTQTLETQGDQPVTNLRLLPPGAAAAAAAEARLNKTLKNR